MNDAVATQVEVEWALTGDTGVPADLVDEVLTTLRDTGRVPEAGVDVLRAAGFRLAAEDRVDEIGQAWLELLDAVRAHPDAALTDLPPARTD